MSYQINQTKYLVSQELSDLKYTLNRYIDSDPRNCLLIWAALLTGARAGELLGLSYADLNPYDQSLFIRGLKGSNDREIPLPPWYFKKLELFLNKTTRNPRAPASTRIFAISYIRLTQIWDFYRPCKKKFHSLRHTFAIELYRKTKDIRLVQVALGHRNIANTMVYADYIYSKEELKKLIL